MEFFENYKFKIKKNELNYRKNLFIFEKKKMVLKSIVFNKKTKRLTKMYFVLKLNKSSYKYPTKLRNYCLFSGRSRSVYKQYKLNRVVLKSFINKGLISGSIKSSF